VTFDLFKTVNHNIGQEIRSSDLVDLSNFLESKLFDQILGGYVPYWNGPGNMTGGFLSSDPQFRGQQGSDFHIGPHALALSVGGGYPTQGSANNKIKIAPGVLLQKIASVDGDAPRLLAYTFSGADEVTIAPGDPTNPRVDLVQMALSASISDSQSRAFLQDGVKSEINCGSHTSSVNSILQARRSGREGDAIALELKNDGSGVGSITVSINTVTFHFQHLITTVANFETAISGVAQSLLEVKTAGTGSLTLINGGDEIPPTNLIGGVDSVIISQVMNMKRRVNCVLSVKSGTPGASPTYPSPDAGCVVIAGIVVNASYAGANPITFQDSGSPRAVVHDQRMPLFMRPVCVGANQFIFNDGASWSLKDKVYALKTGTGLDALMIPCRLGPGGGRLVGFELAYNVTTPPMNLVLSRMSADSVTFAPSNLGMTPTLLGLASEYSGGMAHERHHTPLFGPTIIAAGAPNVMGAPIWTSGYRAPLEPNLPGPSGTSSFGEYLALTISNAGGVNSRYYAVNFYIAGGL